MAQVRRGREDHPPSCSEEPVEPLAVRSDLLGPSVPLTVVFHGEHVLRPSEVDAREEPAVLHDLVLRHRHRDAALLRDLEAEGLVVRRVSTSAPVRVEYELTERGQELELVVRVVSAWAEKWIPE